MSSRELAIDAELKREDQTLARPGFSLGRASPGENASKGITWPSNQDHTGGPADTLPAIGDKG